MPINIEDVIEQAFETAFTRALEQTVMVKAEEFFKKALESGPLTQKLQEKMEKGFERFSEDGIRWEKKKPRFKK